MARLRVRGRFPAVAGIAFAQQSTSSLGLRDRPAPVDGKDRMAIQVCPTSDVVCHACRGHRMNRACATDLRQSRVPAVPEGVPVARQFEEVAGRRPSRGVENRLNTQMSVAVHGIADTSGRRTA
jgi:hypothetical protein